MPVCFPAPSTAGRRSAPRTSGSGGFGYDDDDAGGEDGGVASGPSCGVRIFVSGNMVARGTVLHGPAFTSEVTINTPQMLVCKGVHSPMLKFFPLHEYTSL